MLGSLVRGGVAAAALAVAAVVGAGVPSGARAATFLDAVSWHNAVLDLDAALRPTGRMVRSVPFSVRPVEYEDGYGTFAQNSAGWVFATYSADNPEVGEWVFRAQRRFEMLNGVLYGTLGCNSAYDPCLGATRVTLGFDGDVLGFGGNLLWADAYQSFGADRSRLMEVLPFFSATYDQIGPILDDSGWFLGYGYEGFFGTVGPMTEFDLTFWHEGGVDGFATVRFSGLMLVAVPVPEPPPLPVLLAALALLGLAGARGALSPPAGSR